MVSDLASLRSLRFIRVSMELTRQPLHGIKFNRQP